MMKYNKPMVCCMTVLEGNLCGYGGRATLACRLGNGLGG
jgi:hypothetical protein